jgi:isoleucyl-tRNA synthetase
VRWSAPVLVFTAEEVWGTRYPDAGSVHLLEWPAIDPACLNLDLGDRWRRIREARETITNRIEPLRRVKELGSSLEADVELFCIRDEDLSLLTSVPIDEIAIVSDVHLRKWNRTSATSSGGTVDLAVPPSGSLGPSHYLDATVRRTEHQKCGRCWRYLPEVPEDGALCDRCEDVVNA